LNWKCYELIATAAIIHNAISMKAKDDSIAMAAVDIATVIATLFSSEDSHFYTIRPILQQHCHI